MVHSRDRVFRVELTFSREKRDLRDRGMLNCKKRFEGQGHVRGNNI